MTDFTPWPADAADRYRASGHWLGLPLGTLLRPSDRPALIDGDRVWTHRELHEWANRVAAGLLDRGIGPGDRVLVHLPNVAEFLALFFALVRIGAIPVLALTPHRKAEIGHLADLADVSAYVIPEAHLPIARDIGVKQTIVVGDPGEFTAFADLDAPARDLPDPDPATTAVLLLSGGTTGLPKLIPRTHDDYHYNVRASAEVCGFDEHTRYLAALPMAHNFALACPGVLGALHAGGTVVLTTSADPDTAFALISKHGITATALVPPLVTVWLDAGFRGPLGLLQVGGARLAPETARRVEGCTLQQVYGMAEGLLNYTRLDDPPEIVTTTQGRPLSPDDEIRVVDADGNPVPDGEPGELLTRGPYTLRGYYRADEHNRRAFTDDGFYRTGDLVRRLPTGHLAVAGRTKDVVNRGGDKVPVEEVEDHLLTHPAVGAVAVVGIPDPVLGERTCAYIVPRGTPPTRPHLVRHLTERGLAAFKIPDRVRTLPALPRTPVGKIDRAALARAYPFNDFTGLDLGAGYAEALTTPGLLRVTLPHGGTAWLATRDDDVRAVLADRRFSRSAALTRDAPRALPRIPGGIVAMDPPALTRIRTLVTKAFTVRQVERLRPHVRALAHRLIDDMVAAGPTADLVADYALPIPLSVICALLGVPVADQEKFTAWNDSLLSTTDPAQIGELSAYFAALISARRADPAEDLLSALVQVHDEGDRLGEPDLILLCIAILVAGYEATASQIPNFTKVLLDNPALLERLRRNPHLMDPAVEELLRYVPLASSAMFAHYATEDIQVGDTLVREGEPVLASIGAANRDPARHPAPDTVDIDRPDRAHLAFGHGLHHCVGASLARVELQESLAALITRLPGLRLAGPVEWKTATFFRGPRRMPVTWN